MTMIRKSLAAVLSLLATCASFSNAEYTANDMSTFRESNYQALTGSWYLNATGPAEAEAISADEIQVIIPFNASSRTIYGYILDETCTSPFDPLLVHLELGQNMMLEPFTPYNSTTELNITAIREAGNIWEGTDTSGTFKYCLRQDMVLEDAASYEIINFFENIVTVEVSLDASFSVETVKASRDEATQEEVNVDYGDYVEAYECVNDNLMSEATGEEYSQGDELKICVTSKDSNIVTVEKIKSLTLTQGGSVDDAGAPFAYITDGNVESAELAETACETSGVCWADMQLLGRYFAVENPGDLTASGSVELSFPASSRRLTVDVPITGVRGGDLALDNSVRRIEENPQPEPFDVRVSLTSLVESGSDYYGVSLVSGLVAAAGGAILMV
jgi:hypothetical protein